MSIFGTPNFVGSGLRTTTPSLGSPSFNTSVGDLIVVSAGFVDGTVTGVTDVAGNTYTPGTARTGPAGTLHQFWYCLAATAANASNVVTAVFSDVAQNFVTVGVWDTPLSGGTASLDGDIDSDGANDASTASYSTTGSDEMVFVGGEDQGGSGGYVQQSGYTLDSSGYGTFAGAEHVHFAAPQSSIQSTFATFPSLTRAFGLAFKGAVTYSGPTIVQTQSLQYPFLGPNGNSTLPAFTTTNTMGNSILVAISISGNIDDASTLSVTDVNGNTYNLVGIGGNSAGAKGVACIFRADNISNGSSNAITIHNPSGSYGGSWAAETTPLGTTDQIQGSSSASPGVVGPTITPTQNNTLCLGIGGDQGGNSWSVGTSVAWAVVSASTGAQSIAQFYEQAIAATVQSDFTVSGSGTVESATFVANFPNVGGGSTTVSLTHSGDADIVVAATNTKTHSGDAFVKTPTTVNKQFSGDAFIKAPTDKSFQGDAYVALTLVGSTAFINLQGKIQFPIPVGGFLKFAATVAAQQRQFVMLNGTLKSISRSYVKLQGTIREVARQYIQLQGTISAAKVANPTHNADFVSSTSGPASFILLAANIATSVSPGACSSFPDASFIKLEGWIVIPGDSQQMPNSGFTRSEDFLSSQVALQAYKTMSLIKLNGLNLIVTAFTTGVLSWQTRARSWLTRVDEAPGGILLTTSTSVHTLPNGCQVTTTTEQRQNQDTAVTIVIIQNSATPERVSTIITEKTQNGATITKESDTTTINGVKHTLTKRSVYTQPPETDNIQPITVRTLDGVTHYQFFDQENTEWAGGDAEGLTTTQLAEQVVPGSLNGETTDPFGNPILTRITNTTENDPSGKVTQTNLEETGITDVGTTTTNTNDSFNGIVETTQVTTTYPDGSQEVKTSVKNLVTGDIIATSVETVTDEFGQVTITTTNDETHTFADPVTGVLRTVETKTVTVDKGGVITTDTTVATTDNFEDDIVDDKIKVIFIQEFTITCVLDETTMYAIWETNESHQRLYALQELFGQQLGNATLSYAVRQRILSQFNAANCVPSVPLQALGKVFQVVFAPSASAFRAKYIPGTEPHVYELQMILQERSDMIDGTIGF